jgi:hypothetical protein
MGTKAPYYGSIAVAAALGNSPATVVEIPLDSQISGAKLQPEAAYAIYTSGRSLCIHHPTIKATNNTLFPVSCLSRTLSTQPSPLTQ